MSHAGRGNNNNAGRGNNNNAGRGNNRPVLCRFIYNNKSGSLSEILNGRGANIIHDEEEPDNSVVAGNSSQNNTTVAGNSSQNNTTVAGNSSQPQNGSDNAQASNQLKDRQIDFKNIRRPDTYDSESD